ncbi:MAG: hypothetical protein GDA46_05105 [Bdellovibrionales bacterium]|nr:hypothetical protein [Bdellovibrionales bacterium]
MFLGRYLGFIFFITILSVFSLAEEAQNVQEVIEQCEDSIKSAEKKTTGMDMESYALMQQTVNQVGQIGGKEGKSAKIAHMSSATINGAMGAIATKKCSNCTLAVKKCYSDCDSEEKCDSTQECMQQIENNQIQECTRCKGQLNDEECSEFENLCIQICLQAGLSLAGATANVLAARQLEGCEGKECEDLSKLKGREQEPDLPQLPNSLAQGDISETRPVSNGTSKTDSFAGLRPSTNSNSDSEKGKSQDFDSQAGGFTNLGQGKESHIAKNPNNLSKNPSQFSYSHGGAGNSLGSLGGNVSKKGKKNKHDFKTSDESLEKEFNQGFPKSNQGQTGVQAYSNNYGNLKKGWNKDKKKEKRDLSSQSEELKNTKSLENIFNKMSHFIENVCNGGQRC